MSYNFTFDLSKLPQVLFKEIVNFSEKEKLHEKMSVMARNLVKKFEIEKITGLSPSDSILLIEDFIDIHIKNNLFKKHFICTKKRVLFLPHCCRKYMDSRCKADFNPETSSYICNHCSRDCTINQATKLAKNENYDVYILAGGSCVRKILQKNTYDGIVGVACTEELKLTTKIFDRCKIIPQGVPLIKNGCSETRFNFETLKRIINAGNKLRNKRYTLNTSKTIFLFYC